MDTSKYGVTSHLEFEQAPAIHRVIARNEIPHFTRNRLRNPPDTPSPGGRELEGGGNSPSPYSSPIKGEETFLRLPRLRLAMTKKEVKVSPII